MSRFLTCRGLGVVISVHPTPDLLFTAPITGRLRQRDTTLRASADPSMLVYGLIDLSSYSYLSCIRSPFNLKIVVDSALQVIDVYQSTILELDKVMLLRPKMSTVPKRAYPISQLYLYSSLPGIHSTHSV